VVSGLDPDLSPAPAGVVHVCPAAGRTADVRLARHEGSAGDRGWVYRRPGVVFCAYSVSSPGAMEQTRMAIVVVGLNHTTAPVAVRERLAFSDATLAQALTHFCPPEVHELVILSTCNRVEMYMQTRDVEASVASCVAFLAACHTVPASQFTS